MKAINPQSENLARLAKLFAELCGSYSALVDILATPEMQTYLAENTHKMHYDLLKLSDFLGDLESGS